MEGKFVISTTEYINGKLPKKTLGIVRGNTIRARWFGRDIAAGFKNIFGGEIKSYTKLLNDAREEAVKRMNENARKMGGNAVVNVRFTTSDVMQGAAEILAYGTAVIV
ncbi:YbjQ family protein [archaeon]|jgi:uncharacterized protein YbjQ (UPF0145 family)|nr:YbjQ family protein [archaeon]MBT4241436.1 YbjQ family protein [archaeon]MBT4417693.1 YbjQ family protein [archaeon]